MARALSHEELQVQLILQELQQAEKDLGGTEGRFEVQTVVEMSRGNNEVIRESTPKNKEYDTRLAQRNTIMERLESQRHAIGGDRVEGLKIYHAKSRSSPADVSKAQVNPLERTSKTKQISSQTDLTGKSKSDQERAPGGTSRVNKETNELVQRRQSRRRRSERLEHTEGPKTPEANQTVKPVVRSERKIKLSTSGGTGLTDERASTLPRCKPHRKHRHALRQQEESESTDDDSKARDRSKTDSVVPKSAGFPRDGDDRRRSLGDSSLKSPSHMKGARIAKLKLSTGEESSELINQTARLLSASEETKHDSNIKISQDALHSLTQASDFLKNQLPAKDERERESRGRDRDRSERSRDREKERKDKSIAKIKGHVKPFWSMRSNVVQQKSLGKLPKGRGKSHGPHKFHIPVVPRRHSFDDRILANSVSKPSGGESSFTRESIGREAELEMKLAIVSNALMKEGEEKQRLESDLKKTVKENRKLQENLQTASKQLRKFTEWFFSNAEKSSS
ncbi:hypothetical protein QZH41_005557 [Actinostola sp. cb2023]|nr:hypothetical protein QZH41_005557 [Actinostola sp. cb2023]